MTVFWGELMYLVMCPRDREGEGDSAGPIGGVGEEVVYQGAFVYVA